MTDMPFLSADALRTLFSRAMSEMYRAEVPQYGALLDLVAATNANAMARDPALATRLRREGELDRLAVERHGAIRLGTPEELRVMGRVFAAMGMSAVGYYDLSVAGVPVHSTAFRPVGEAALRHNPFRVFTSLLRLELIADLELRQQAAAILARRRIFTPGLLRLLALQEAQGGLAEADAAEFVREALETFRWHNAAIVDAGTYHRMHDAHRLLADIVCFRGPHINHLTPRTLDIDAAQLAMPARGIAAKATIEGPPRRRCPILLRQTSFKALEEAILFPAVDGALQEGTHTARFGEIEQRGAALTPKGRALYDRLLGEARTASAGRAAAEQAAVLEATFSAFPDDLETMRRQGLAFFRYTAVPDAASIEGDPEALLRHGVLRADPVTYEDFLPVSAAGIFQSNLGEGGQGDYAANGNRAGFEAALGGPVLDEMTLYAEIEAASLRAVAARLSRQPQQA
jgi:uncharacterized glyoxalase superfamily metalloenzyme YdcJ